MQQNYKKNPRNIIPSPKKRKSRPTTAFEIKTYKFKQNIKTTFRSTDTTLVQSNRH